MAFPDEKKHRARPEVAGGAGGTEAGLAINAAGGPRFRPHDLWAVPSRSDPACASVYLSTGNSATGHDDGLSRRQTTHTRDTTPGQSLSRKDTQRQD